MGDVVCLDGGLFPEPERTVPPPDERTNGQRRRDRQEAALARGQHPLSVALGSPLPLHPDVRDAAMTGADVVGPTCGTCRYRKPYNSGHARSYPKCLAYPQPRREVTGTGDERIWTDFPRVSNGEGTDVRASWPACRDYLEK